MNFHTTIVILLAGVAGACAMDRPGDDAGTAEQDLRARAAELLPAVEGLSGLQARRPLNFGLRARSDLEAFLEAELDEQFAGDRIAHLLRVYGLLGLVPDSLELEPLMRRLLMEQVVGFYDPSSDSLFVVQGVDESLVEAVLVHEMVHALQDQYVDLDSVVDASRERNDPGLAAQAAIEGHATFVMIEWMLGQVTGDVDLTLLPPLSEALGDEALGAAGMGMPELERAPTIIREQLLFPYVAGLDYVQALWSRGEGRVPPIGDAMPSTTEQILHARSGSTPGLLAPPVLEFDAQPEAPWREVVSDGLGEFDLRLFLREWLADRELADRAAAGWDGDTYRLVETDAADALIWVTHWDRPADATEFVEAGRRALTARHETTTGRAWTVTRAGERTVVIVDRTTDGPPLPPSLTRVRRPR